MSALKILLGGVPLGCDNVGDEAIVTCVVQLLRKIAPEAELTVSTKEGEKTARLLGVRTVPLCGFPPELAWELFAGEVRRHDVYLWFGATGLSDYPENALRLLDIARKAGVKTILWGVGMNSQLNPAFYKAGGKRLKLLRLLDACSLGLADWVKVYEGALCRRTRRHIRRSLEKCALAVVRDEESAGELARCGFDSAVIGADTAMLLKSAPPPLPPAPGAKRIGFCISAQNAVRDLEGIRQLWNSLLERSDVRLVLIPMNPKTDRKLMLDIASGVDHPERVECLERDLPAEVQACAGQCRLVVSSRLHLLILAANAGVPGLGIERGSKITNFLKAFGRNSSGSVENCDLGELRRQILELLDRPPEETRQEIETVMSTLRARLAAAAELLRQTLLRP